LLITGRFDVGSVLDVSRDLIHQSALLEAIRYGLEENFSGLMQVSAGGEVPLVDVARLISEFVPGSKLSYNKIRSDQFSPKSLKSEKGIRNLVLKNFSFPYDLEQILCSFEYDIFHEHRIS